MTSSLVSALGYGDDARVVIVNGRGLGTSHAVNVGVYETLREGLATTTALLVPCPWARDAASRYRGDDVGVELTLNAEHDLYRWGPITHAPSLLDGNGGFPTTTSDLWDHGDLDEVRRECRAQIERAVYWGFDVTHLDDHLGVLAMRPEFFDVYLDLAVEFALPIHLPGTESERQAGFPFRSLAAEEGILFPDYVVDIGPGPSDAFERAMFSLEPGVTEFRLRPALDTPELRALHRTWADRVEHREMLCSAGARQLVNRAGAVRIGYRSLRAIQRARQVRTR